MNIPAFTDLERAGELVTPNVRGAIEAGLYARTAPVQDDERKIALMLVDAQIDFVHADGALSVPGAVEDAKHTADWLYRNTPRISHIFASLDSHIPLQIFFPTWWADHNGIHPEPYTAITAQDVEQGSWRPLYEKDWSLDYVRSLREQARKDLMIWPFHVLIGTPGHALTPILYEAIAYHSAARSAPPTFELKGSIAKTEYYSLLEPEVKVPEDPRGTLNEALLERLLSFDAVYFAGQAKSHCVLETLASIFNRYGDDRDLMRKLYLLEDCSSCVKHPEIDFEALADETLKRFSEMGMRRVQSSEEVA